MILGFRNRLGYSFCKHTYTYFVVEVYCTMYVVESLYQQKVYRDVWAFGSSKHLLAKFSLAVAMPVSA